MLSQAIEASSRAFGMLVYILLWLWMSNRAFPSNWLAIGILYVALMPVALLYHWLTVSRPKSEASQLFFPVPKLVVIAVGAVIVILGSFKYDTQVNAVLYSGAH